MIHDLNPFIWRISGEFGIRWYGMAYLLGFVCAYFLLTWLVPKQRAGLTREMVSDFVFYTALGVLVGGRLGYVFFYAPELLKQFGTKLPYWGVLAVNQGGMASHGGMIGVIVSSYFYARKHGIKLQYLFDLIALTGPVGIFFGRIANFINGELVGRPCSPDFPLAVKFPQDLYEWYRFEPGKLMDLVPVVEKLNITKETWQNWFSKMNVDSSSAAHIQDTISQIIHSVQNGNVELKIALGQILTPRHPSQLYAALGEGLFLFLVLFIYWRKPRTPGLVSATFVILYSIVRISDEFFRMPDADIGFQLFGLTRGQWLSIGLGIIGLVLYFVWSRSSALSIYGWGRGENIKLNRK